MRNNNYQSAMVVDYTDKLQNASITDEIAITYELIREEWNSIVKCLQVMRKYENRKGENVETLKAYMYGPEIEQCKLSCHEYSFIKNHIGRKIDRINYMLDYACLCLRNDLQIGFTALELIDSMSCKQLDIIEQYPAT